MREFPYPEPSSPAVTAVMKGNKRSGTKPEAAIRSLLHRYGYRFRKDHRIDLGQHKCRPDIVFPTERVAVFVDGCFWHKCAEHGRIPGGKNAAYWAAKLDRNARRDRENSAQLEAAGWTVIRVWEHVPVHRAAMVVRRAVDRRRSRPLQRTG